VMLVRGAEMSAGSDPPKRLRDRHLGLLQDADQGAEPVGSRVSCFSVVCVADKPLGWRRTSHTLSWCQWTCRHNLQVAVPPVAQHGEDQADC